VFSSAETVSPAAEAKVREAAERLGYVPNAIAGSLRSNRTGIIGAVVPAHSEYWQGVLTSLSHRLVDQGKQLLLFSFADTDHVEAALESVQRYWLDGLVRASSTLTRDHLARMNQPNQRVVVFNQPAAEGLLPVVTVDNEAGAHDLAAHLIDQEVQTTVFVGTMATASTDQLRYRGASTALAARGIACPYVESGAFSYDAGYKIAAHFLNGAERPDAIMAGNDAVALGLIDGRRNGGVDVSGDVLVTGFDGLPQASWAGYDLTTLVQPHDVLVEQTLDLIFRESDDSAHAVRVVPGTVRVGTTTRRCGQSTASGTP